MAMVAHQLAPSKEDSAETVKAATIFEAMA